VGEEEVNGREKVRGEEDREVELGKGKEEGTARVGRELESR